MAKEFAIAKNFIVANRAKRKNRRLIAYQMGGSFNPSELVVQYPELGYNSTAANEPASSSGSRKGLLGQRIMDFAPYISNLTAATRQLPNVPKPQLESGINANLVDYTGDIANLERDMRGINLGTNYTSNPAALRAYRASSLGKYLSTKGSLLQGQRNTNAQIVNQTRAFNQGVNARNVERNNEYLRNQISRTINQQNLNQSNIADFSNKIQLARRDRDIQALENRKWDYLNRAYNDTGVVGRNMSDLISKEKEDGGYIDEYGMGGSIYIKPSHKGKFTRWAKSHNMGVQEAASHVLAAPKGTYSSSVRKMANFARNFGGRK